jgi:aspartate aminotransferase-like enzyme
MTAAVRNDRVTGPVPVPPAVLAAVAGQMVSHRHDDFREVMADVAGMLRPVFGTTGPVLPFTCSGTGGLEAAVSSAFRPGDAVLVVDIGYFGGRFAEVARACGLRVEVVAAPWGQVVEPGRVADAVRRHRFDGVLITHNETSTGVLAPLAELVRAARSGRGRPLVVADVVSSLAATPVDFDAIGLDIAVSVTQKALACPPGLALLAVSPDALERCRARRHYGLYLDVARMAEAMASDSTTYTPAISVVYGLRESLRAVHAEGVEAVWRRHARTAATSREAVAEAGLAPAADPAYPSPTVTAIRLPDGVAASRVRQRLSDVGVRVSSGRGPWKETVLRIGHMGPVDPDDVTAAVRALAGAAERQRSWTG